MKIGIHHIVFLSVIVAIGIFTFMISSLFERGEIVFTDIQQYSGPIITKYNPYLGGDADPKVRLVLYSNFTCPNCAEFSKTVREAIADKNAVLIWKDLPNDSLNPYSSQAALAAHCAADYGRFWQYHDSLMAQNGQFTPTTFTDIATQIGLSANRMTKCMDKKTFQPVIDQSIDEATQLKITTAPTLFVGNDRFATGVLNADLLRERLDLIIGL
jgi:protein-disulfide isomerase